ncbi:hypothetical protein [Nostoc sphaeroides]|uniref:Uncharacterized protein n=1 Tax=Nostoc sphaeroides CCNUC1 TaxID=2653204 RepID=A0A5P8W0B8_9NOSO|nr:hypothetical protein [Nostoc sphaeroides]QFS46123.1 hypothetical protein GXM_03603 [Nostoc sphaeroides CCNUC1]
MRSNTDTAIAKASLDWGKSMLSSKIFILHIAGAEILINNSYNKITEAS